MPPFAAKGFQHLQVGKRYVVVEAFEDYDRYIHPVGECWTFLGHDIFGKEDGLSLYLSRDDRVAWHVRLQWIPQEQGAIIDNLERYVRPTSVG